MNSRSHIALLLIYILLVCRSFSFAATEAQIADKKPVYFECRNNQLFYISLDNIRKAVDEKTDILREQVDSNPVEFVKLVPKAELEVDGYRVNYSHAIAGVYNLQPSLDAKSESFKDERHGINADGFSAILSDIDPATQYVHVFVRSNSLALFNQAKETVRIREINITSSLLDDNQNIRIRFGSYRDIAQ